MLSRCVPLARSLVSLLPGGLCNASHYAAPAWPSSSVVPSISPSCTPPHSSASYFRSTVPMPLNEPVSSFRKGSPEREGVQKEVKRMRGEVLDIPLIIGGKEVRTGRTVQLRIPHDHQHVLANVHQAGEKEIAEAIEVSLKAHKAWNEVSFDHRMAVFLKMADLLAGPYRSTMLAATVLGQSKNFYQAEIDSTCELIDFLRFNVQYVQDIIEQQPISSRGVWNRLEHRALEGFIYAVTPFNFTAIAGNLTTAPAMMGNVVLFKPSDKAVLSNYHLMQLFKEAGLPDGIINFIPGPAGPVSDQVLASPHFAGLHYTGSTEVFKKLWLQSAKNLGEYKSYPRIVGETGGKDFVFAHPSAHLESLAVALVRGAFEYAGQKCSAASRAYIPKSVWPKLKQIIGEKMSEVVVGNPEDPRVLVNAVIDESAANRCARFFAFAKESKECEILHGGNVDKSKGWFVEPTIIVTTNPRNKLMMEEIFAPVLTIYVYDDNKLDETLNVLDACPYGLTGAIFAQDRSVIDYLEKKLTHAAGNFYINDKPTGAVVGQQPFGGGRISGTNDKAGSYLNLLRWTSVRSIKETFVPNTDVNYPYMGDV